MAKRQLWKATTKPRGSCPSPQCDTIFTGFGATRRQAKDNSESHCRAAGCHTPGGKPFTCDCGHTTTYTVPNRRA